jgi:hypothetical protein
LDHSYLVGKLTTSKIAFRVFRSLLILILLGAFLAFSSSGAGLGKRTRKPLGAHLEKIFDRNKGEHGRFECSDQITYRLYGFLRWKIQNHQILASIASSLLSFIYSLLRSKRQE